MKTLYTQLKDIVTIRVYDKKESQRFKYIDEVREEESYEKWYHRLYFKKTITKTHYKGYYESYFHDNFSKYQTLYTVEQLENQAYIVDDNEKIVYEKPRVEFKFSNKDEFHKSFDSMTELDAFLQPLVFRNSSLIKLIG